MSEEDGKHFCFQNATPKQREIWRNIAIMAWIMGMVPAMVAVVTSTGTSTMFAVLVVLNIIFIIINCGFCCVNLQTLRKKRFFYITCLLFMVVITAVIIVTVVTASENEFQIVGLAGAGLTFISCVAFLLLNILLHIHGPVDPVSSENNVMPEQCDDIPSEILTIRYVSTLRGRIQEESFFRVQAGQILSHSQPSQVTDATQSAQPTQRTRRPSVFGFRTREESEPERERRRSIERLPIQMISDGVHTPQRRDSAFSQMSLNSQRRDSSLSVMSLNRRTSTSSIEYDTASVRCTCYYLPNETTDSDDAPPYSETPTGNMTICPLHGENPIPTPAYDDNTSTYSLYRVLGLPEYDEVVITKPVILSSMLKDVTESSPSDNHPTSVPTTTTRRPMDSPNRTDWFSNAHNQIIFETIFEDRAERTDSFMSENTSQESDTASTLPSTSATATTTESAAAEGPSVVITTTAADFTDQTTFSTSKQTA